MESASDKVYTNFSKQKQIYDLVIPERISQQVLWKTQEPRQPGVHTNFYPPGPFIGATPFTRGVNVVGPPSLTVDDYLAGDSNYVPLEVPGIVGAVSIPNRFGWNITRVSYINGLCYANGPGQQDLTNVPVAFVYLLHRPNEQMEIIWWELQDVNEFRVDTSVPKMPPLLDRKLLHDNRAWLQPQCDSKTKANPDAGASPRAPIITASSVLGFVPLSIINSFYNGDKAWLHL
ncbi:hypothetical protein HDK77DRAFT_485146 [Phyllosticta capitalensis]